MKHVIRILCLLLIGLLSLSANAEQPEENTIKVLLLTGQSSQYHSWQASSPVVKKILDQVDIFEVDVATSPAQGGDMSGFEPDFKIYDVVVIDYGGDYWSEKTQLAFVDYVKSGGGVVIIHASNNAFPKWAEYNEMIGLGGWEGRNEKDGPMIHWKDGQIVRDNSVGGAGHHGPASPFQIVNRVTDHPITKGLPEKWMHATDELYSNLRGPAKNLTVLSTAYADPANNGTGKHEPILFTVNYGEGRVFHTVLGHANAPGQPPMKCVGFIVTLQRGTEWAASGNVTQAISGDFPMADKVSMRENYEPPKIENLLVKVTDYKYGQSLEHFFEITNFIRNAKDDPKKLKQIEQKLISFLESNSTIESKQFICQKLSEIGTEASVGVLAKLLVEDNTTDMARYALERIPSGKVDDALRNALSNTRDKMKIGIISSIGNRRDSKSVSALAALIDNGNADIAKACISALGQIADAEAAKVLSQAKGKSSGDIHELILDAYIRCAEEFARRNDNEQAIVIYNELLDKANPRSIRIAALKGKVAVSPDRADIVIDVLRSDDQLLKTAAITAIKEIAGTEIVKAVSDEMANLTAAEQVQLISVLAERGDRQALDAVITACNSEQVEVRIAALKAMGVLGDFNTVKLLAIQAVNSHELEQKTARESLYLLKGLSVDQTIITLIESSEGKVKAELIKSVAQRRIASAVDILLQSCNDEDRKIRIESTKALKDVSSREHLPALVDVLINARNDKERGEAEKTLFAIVQKVDGTFLQAKVVLDSLVKVTGNVEAKSSLLEVLGRIGDKSGLDVLKAALKDENKQIQTAVVRALGDWPNALVINDLLEIVKNSEDQLQKVLAIRGYIRLISLDEKTAEEKLEMYKTAISLSFDTNEYRMILKGLTDIKNFEALQVAAGYLDNEQLYEEAAWAAVEIAKDIFTGNPEEVRAIILKVLEVTKNELTIYQASEIIKKLKKFEGFITAWQVTEAYSYNNSGPQALFDIELGPEKGNDEDITWYTMPTRTNAEMPWLLEMDKAVGGDNQVVYLRNKIWSQQQRKVKLEIGSDDGIKVWINDKLVHKNNAARGTMPGEDVIQTELKQGWNSFLLKVTNGGGAWSFCLRIVDVDGNPIDDLKTDIDLAGKRGWFVHDLSRPQPEIVKSAINIVPPPSNATVLFDGKDLSKWQSLKNGPAKWIVKDGYMEVAKKAGDIRTKGSFGSCKLHVEWASPKEVKGHSQERGNSGIFLMGKYEVQVLDCYNNMTYPDGQAGAIYGQYPPLYNACLGPGQWQSYDITFYRPIFNENGKLTKSGRISVLHNGVLVQKDVELLGETVHKKRAKYKAHADKLPIVLQDHGNPVKYRNIWLVELP